MKVLFATSFALITSVGAFSQDTLFTRNGQVIPAKVYEINPTEIKYKKPSNPDGPLYTVSKDEIAVIEYKNGSKDVFQQTSDNANNSSGQNQTAQNNGAVTNNNYYPSPRPRLNVVIAPPPIMIGPSFGYSYYRPYRYHRHCRRWGW